MSRMNEIQVMRDSMAANARFHGLLSRHTDHNGNNKLTPPEIEALKVEAGLIEAPPAPAATVSDPSEVGNRLAGLADEDGKVDAADAIRSIYGDAPAAPAEVEGPPPAADFDGGAGGRRSVQVPGTRAQQIAQAEATGDWAAASALKSQILQDRIDRA